jgi:di/tripeptidase
MELEELERKYRELGEEIERIKSKPEELWIVDWSGLDGNIAYHAHHIVRTNDCDSKACVRQSNAFSTELEAARMAERFNLELEISKFIKDNHGEVDWKNNKGFYIDYYKNNDSLGAYWSADYHNGAFEFSTKTLAQRAIDIYGSRLKFAWGITDER